MEKPERESLADGVENKEDMSGCADSSVAPDSPSGAAKPSVFLRIVGSEAARIAAGVLGTAVLVTGGILIGRYAGRSSDVAASGVLSSAVSAGGLETSANTAVETSEESVKEAGSPAETSEDAVRAESTPPAEEIGFATPANTAGNSNNGGYVCLYGEWIYYYTAPSWNGHTPKEVVDTLMTGIHRMSLDGSRMENYVPETAYNLNIADSWIYFRNRSGIFRGEINGRNGEVLSKNEASYMQVVGDWIYYANESDDGMIYKMRTDGGETQKLVGNKSRYLNVVGDLIYYCNQDDHGKLYTVKTDGSASRKIGDDQAEYAVVSGQRIYYVNGSDRGKIYSIQVDGSDNRRLNDSQSEFLNLSGGRLYYANEDAGGRLYTMRLDGSDNRPLGDATPARDICVAGDWIFYTEDSDWGGGTAPGRLHRIKTDGTQGSVINDYSVSP